MIIIFRMNIIIRQNKVPILGLLYARVPESETFLGMYLCIFLYLKELCKSCTKVPKKGIIIATAL